MYGIIIIYTTTIADYRYFTRLLYTDTDTDTHTHTVLNHIQCDSHQACSLAFIL